MFRYRILIFESGFTLLELMIANMLSGMVLLILLAFYSHCLHFYYQQQQRLEILENIRFLDSFLRMEFQNVTAVEGVDNGLIFFKTGGQGNVKKYLYLRKIIDPSQNNLKSGLFIKEAHKPREELMRGIEDMQILYGIKCQHSENICLYLPVSAVKNWSQVMAVEIGLFLQKDLSIPEWKIYIGLQKSPTPHR